MKKPDVQIRDLNDLLQARSKRTPPMPKKLKPPGIPPRIDGYNWGEAFNYARDVRREVRYVQDVRSEHLVEVLVRREDVAEVLGAEDGRFRPARANDEGAWIGLFKLRDGRYMFLTAWCDYTGWGCQEGGDCTFYTSRKAAIQDLGDQNLHRLGLKMEY